MSFFKDFKEDFAQAAKELMPGGGESELELEDDMQVDTIAGDLDVESEMAKLNGFLESMPDSPSQPADADAAEEEEEKRLKELEAELLSGEPKEPAKDVTAATAAAAAATVGLSAETETQNDSLMEDKKMDTMEVGVENEVAAASTATMPEPAVEEEVSDEEAVITQGMTITGDVETAGSIEIRGAVKGNVKCRGKMVVTGHIQGNSHSSEFFADSADIKGEISSTGTVKVGLGSKIIGNIEATSAVIAGAIKGDIDVKGPVVVDTSAVIMGNIKSRSVQINNGAVIEGFCSQAYADVDLEKMFGE